jgi:nucleotide-binding universal stress UspA family protein
LAYLKKNRLEQSSSSTHGEGECVMDKILVPVDGSHNAHLAARHVIDEFRKNSALEIHLLNVQHPFSKRVTRFVSHRIRDSYHQGESEKVLKPICKMLDAANVTYSVHMEVGRKAEVITETARRLGCDLIVMATSRKDSLTRMLETSVTNRVVELTTVPVELIAGDAVSTVERFALPAGIAGVIGLTLLAMAD